MVLFFFNFMFLFIAFYCFGSNHAVDGENSNEYGRKGTNIESEPAAEKLQGSQFRISAMNYPPLMSIAKDPDSGVTTYMGITVDCYNYLAQHYNLTLVYVPEKASEVAKYGQTQAAMNTVVNGEVDLSSYGMIPTPERLKMFDMTSPVISDAFKIMVKWPEEYGQQLAVIARPFDDYTWSLIALSFLVLIGVLTALHFLHNREIHPTFNSIMKTLNLKIMYVVGITTNHGQSIPYNSRQSLRILLGIWLLMMIVLINAYTGVLTSYLAISKLKPIPQSLEQLAEMKDKYHVTVMKNNVLANDFLNASSGPYKVLGDTLRKHPELLFSEYYQATENVLKRHAANVELSMAVSFRIAADYKMNKKCRLTASNLMSLTQSYASALPKNSPNTKIVEKEMWRAVETGLIDYWKKKHVPSMDRCSINNKKDSNKPRPFTFINLSCAFFVLAVGLGLALLAFLLENVISLSKKIRENARK